MTTVSEVIDAYNIAWQDCDENARRRLLEKAWADEGTYVDSHSQMEIKGQDGLLAYIGQAQEEFPGPRIAPTSVVEELIGRVRFTWAMYEPDKQPVTEGTDFGELARKGDESSDAALRASGHRGCPATL